MTTTPSEQPQINPARRAWVESISLLLRYKWPILVTTVVATAAMAVYLFAFAKMWYKAEANVVPARRSSGGLLEGLSSGITSTIKDLGITPIAGKSRGDGTYSPLALIASRAVQDTLIKEFDLKNVYNAQTNEDAIKEFASHAAADVLEEGNISVTFEDTDPVRAAKIANRIVEELNSVNSKLAITEAKFNRTYIEERYNNLLSELDSADNALGKFQQKYGVYELKTQAAAQLTVIGLLEQQKYGTEIQLSNAEQLYGSGAPEVNILRSQLNGLTSKLDDLRTGMDKNASSNFVPTNLMPDVALDYLRLTREVEIQSKLKAFMLPSYEQAKLDETRLSLTYLTLDKALPPLQKSRPKRSITLLLTLFGSFGISSLVVIGFANYRLAKSRFHRDKAALGL